ncbi:MAG: hypothetical protein WB760_28405 [Xanthobacteraceae bacterium]
MPDRSNLQLIGLAALVVTMVLCVAGAVAPLHAKKAPAHEPPVQPSAPLPARHIHCAMELGQGPCGLDPAMQRLNSGLLHSVRPAPPFEGFDFGPER